MNEVAKKLLPVVDNKSQAIFEAWLLIEKVTQLPRATLLARFNVLTLLQEEKLASLLHLRIRDKMPLAYILGDVLFAGISVTVRPPILIPRSETEEMVMWIIEQYKPLANSPVSVLDMCTGSGCIALALAAAFPAWQVLGIDINPEAIKLARENKKRLNLSNVNFEQGCLFKPEEWEIPVDLIVSNPPYVSPDRIDRVTSDVLTWEDHNALFAELGGWAFYNGLINLSGRIIKSRFNQMPQVVVEFGVDQENMAQYLFDRGCKSIEVKHDIAGLSRWVGWQI